MWRSCLQLISHRHSGTTVTYCPETESFLDHIPRIIKTLGCAPTGGAYLSDAMLLSLEVRNLIKSVFLGYAGRLLYVGSCSP